MNNIVYIGNLFRLIRSSFGEKIPVEFVIKNLPFIIYDYDEMKRQCSDVCAKLNYEYVDEPLFVAFIQKWRKKLQDYNRLTLDTDFNIKNFDL